MPTNRRGLLGVLLGALVWPFRPGSGRGAIDAPPNAEANADAGSTTVIRTLDSGGEPIVARYIYDAQERLVSLITTGPSQTTLCIYDPNTLERADSSPRDAE